MVISGGDRPMTALLDNRTKTAGVGAMVGVALPVGVLILCGTLRRRYRFCDEVAADLHGRVPFVAVLPELTGDGAIGAAAVHGVHDLRVRLQPPDASETRMYLITSVAPGEGKSSLAVALGLSFAASGFRTLLIDGDLTSRRVTSGFNGDEAAGMIEAVSGAEPNIQRIRAGLSVLTAGKCLPHDACKLAPAATGRVLAALRERFDVVLIDSEPMLTGLAASVIAPRVDGVILTLARGQEESLTRIAAHRVERLGSRLAGAVFNRAAEIDFRSLLKERPLPPVAGDRTVPEKLSRFGPLVSIMLSSLSLSREDDLELMQTGVALARSDDARRAAA
jgi:Mrp family chromosome partitioning ATPase